MNVHDDLWAGVHLKIQYAGFHLLEMQRSLHPPELTHNDIVQISSGAIVANNWQQRFFPHFDAFLMAARSVPEIINACFGPDRSPQMKDWFNDLDSDEKSRRLRFGEAFKLARESSRVLPLSQETAPLFWQSFRRFLRQILTFVHAIGMRRFV